MTGADARAVIVTGASSGTGLAAAQNLAPAGHGVVLTARSSHLCEEAAVQLRSEGADAHAVPLDLSDPASIDQLVKGSIEVLGHVDVLVSNAGLSQRWYATSTDPTMLRAILETNLVGAQELVARLVPAMREAGRGELVFLSSDVVVGIPRPRMSAYTASKYALEGWVSVLQAELEGTGIRASVVRPGPTQTNHADGWDPEEMVSMFDEWNARGVMRHWSLLQPEDVAATIAAVITAPAHVHLRLLEVMPSAPRAEEAL